MATISFQPKTYNIEWDGESPAKVSFALTCPSTAASYVASSYPVFTAGESIVIGNSTYVFRRGIQLAFNNNGNLSYASSTNLDVDASTTSVTITFSSLTSTYKAHAWKLTETKGGTQRVLVSGLINRVTTNPYVPSSPTISVVAGVTASTGRC